MDKRVIFAVAGAGKTSFIVDSITIDRRFLIITYTDSNYINLSKKISKKYQGVWPDNVTLLTFFQFLFRFCYKPLLSDIYKAKGILFDSNDNRWLKQDQKAYYLTALGYFYSNRLSLFLHKAGIMNDIRNRIEKYFDVFMIDEVQDIAGRDFTFLEQLMESNVSMLFVGDFYQHTYDTSRDGNVNKGLFDDKAKYIKRFTAKGFTPDEKTLVKSWRCSKTICNYVSENLGIMIDSNRTDDTCIEFITDKSMAEEIINNRDIIKLHYRNGSKYGIGHKNWGETKGEDCYEDVCVVLNKETMKKYKAGKLKELAPATKNKLYVAITRAHRNVYMICE